MARKIAPWDGASTDCTGYTDAYVNVVGLVGGDSIQLKTSVTGANPANISCVALADFSNKATIVADGAYNFPIAGFCSYTKAGPGAAPTVNLILK